MTFWKGVWLEFKRTCVFALRSLPAAFFYALVLKNSRLEAWWTVGMLAVVNLFVVEYIMKRRAQTPEQ